MGHCTTLHSTVTAPVLYPQIAWIILGFLQYLALTHGAYIWLRTYSSSVSSEAVVQSVVCAEFFPLLIKFRIVEL